MTTTSAENKSSKKGNSVNKMLLLITTLLFCFCGYLVWQFLQQQEQIESLMTQNTEVLDERDKLKFELEDMLIQYESLKGDNESLNDELTLKQEEVKALMKKMKGKNWTIHKLQKEAATLRTIMQGYVSTIDSLNTLNIGLRAENQIVKNELSSEKESRLELASQNENLNNQVVIASHLKAIKLRAYGVRVKNDNTGKETDRAKKASKLRTTFTIQENKITVSGKKWIYVRILTPDGKVLSQKTDDSNKFDFNGVRGLYSSKKLIDYANKELQLTIDWKKSSEFSTGEYIVEIYADGVDIGKTKFSLK